jgi:hypothetical protein
MDTLFSAEYRDCRELRWNGAKALYTEVLVVQPQFLYVFQLGQCIDDTFCHRKTSRN